MAAWVRRVITAKTGTSAERGRALTAAALAGIGFVDDESARVIEVEEVTHSKRASHHSVVGISQSRSRRRSTSAGPSGTTGGPHPTKKQTMAQARGISPRRAGSGLAEVSNTDPVVSRRRRGSPGTYFEGVPL